MTPQTPEWRRNEGDAVLDGELAMEKLGWKGYKLETTWEKPWAGRRVKWHKAVKNGRKK